MTTQELLPIIADQKDEFLNEDFTGICSRDEEKLVDLKSRLAQVVIGVRRSGKSTLCRKVLREANVNAAYVNFDDERLENVQTSDLNNILEALYIVYENFDYLLLDELQNVDGWPLFVNRLLRQKMHLIVTGSNAKLLSNELTTHLTGRHHKITLFPFSFDEYSRVKEVDMKALTTKGQATIKRELSNYLMNGGMPEMLTESDPQGYIMGLLEAIIKRDICKRFKVRYPEVLQRLATYLIDNFSQEYNATVIGELLGVSDHTIDTYTGYLQEAFLLLAVQKFSYKSRDRIRDSKIYVIDNGFISNRTNTFSSENLGWRLENAVYIELFHRAGMRFADVSYYRDRTFEVDFIIAKDGVVEELYQVCYDMSSEKTRKREISSILQGAKKFRCSNLTIITFDQEETITEGGYTIHVIPAAPWLTK